MDQLSIYLPPFAGDYTGVCSALYDLNCVVIIDDASCCTRNYVSYDEPRWTVKRKTTFCSRLRTIDAVLGDDEKLILEAVDAARKYDPEFIALVGTPVPAVIGKDMNGIAYEIEARCGYPALGFDTTGFNYYNKGISAAFLKLLARFAVEVKKTSVNSINIIGLTPLDFASNGNNRLLVKLLEDNGFAVVCSFLMDAHLDEVRRAAAAKVNLVVSQSGWAAAKYMEQRFGIPYVVGNPVGRKHSHTVIQAVKQSASDRKSRILHDNAAAGSSASAMLIVGDQVMANSIRAALHLGGCRHDITVASFFAMEPELSLPGDLYLRNERAFIDILNSGKYDRMIADPLFIGVPAAWKMKCHALPHPAVSSVLHWDDVPLLLSDAFETTLQGWI